MLRTNDNARSVRVQHCHGSLRKRRRDLPKVSARYPPGEPHAEENRKRHHGRQCKRGYFVRDRDSTPDRLVFNRTVGLRDTFAKEVAKG